MWLFKCAISDPESFFPFTNPTCIHVFVFRPDAYDRGLIHAIESVVIDWTHQIRDVLKKDSAQPLLEGQHPSPMVEIEFWKAKAQNLECIYEQLNNPKVRMMAQMLERANSSYYPSFKNIFTDVVEGTKIKKKWFCFSSQKAETISGKPALNAVKAASFGTFFLLTYALSIKRRLNLWQFQLTARKFTPPPRLKHRWQKSDLTQDFLRRARTIYHDTQYRLRFKFCFFSFSSPDGSPGYQPVPDTPALPLWGSRAGWFRQLSEATGPSDALHLSGVGQLSALQHSSPHHRVTAGNLQHAHWHGTLCIASRGEDEVFWRKESQRQESKTRSSRASLQFPVGRIHRHLRTGNCAEKIGAGAFSVRSELSCAWMLFPLKSLIEFPAKKRGKKDKVVFAWALLALFGTRLEWKPKQ